MKKEIASIILLFLTAQMLGLFVGKTLTDQSHFYSEFESLSVAPAGGGNAESSLVLMLYILAGAALLLLVIRVYHGVMLYKLLEAGIVFGASNIVFYVVLFAFGIPDYLELSLLLSLALALAKFVMPSLKNTTAVIASAGVGAVFGFSFDPLPAVLFMVGLSIYDIWAVFGTRHMVTMARELGGRNLSFSVNAESVEKVRVPVQPTPAQKRKGAGPKFREEERKSSLELGTGDIAVPLMLAVSSYKSGSLIAPLAIVAASAIALYFVLWYVSEKRVFLPALPPLTAAGIIALALVQLAGL
ncbi:Signal-peptide peptidase, presenilin aspartyl protease [Candidatus Burarchaeum australiense]|nr:Signal-peptide peptidase, presenilin aspartyl protease [Candidatus Burarchaeum australiense]